MKTSVSVNKWGNGLGLHLPKAFVQMLDIHNGDKLSLKIEDNAIKVRKQRKDITLEELMSGMTYETMNSYFDEQGNNPFGASVGREVW